MATGILLDPGFTSICTTEKNRSATSHHENMTTPLGGKRVECVIRKLEFVFR